MGDKGKVSTWFLNEGQGQGHTWLLNGGTRVRSVHGF